MKKYSFHLKNYICLITVLISIFTPYKVLAVTDTVFYSSNDILFYNPNDTGCTGTTSIGTVDLVKSDSLQQIFQLLVNGGMNTGQAAAVMGNMYAESGFNSDAHEAGNNIGYGLAQWSFNRRTQLEDFARLKGIAASDVPTQIEFLLNEYKTTYKSSLDKTAFKDGSDIAASTEAWMNIFEAPLAQPSNDPAHLNSRRIPAAIAIYGFYSNLTINSTVVYDGCNNSGNGVVAGNIISTATNFALTEPAKDGTTALSSARATYQAAKAQYNPSVDVTDCGGFVATVMIASGVDPNYPNVGVTKQFNYISTHSDKYKIITNPKATDLQPGDILITTTSQHTELYTGNQKYTDIDASLGQRVPSVRISGYVWMLQNGAIIARVIK